jgi:hypothetical protein
MIVNLTILKSQRLRTQSRQFEVKGRRTQRQRKIGTPKSEKMRLKLVD